VLRKDVSPAFACFVSCLRAVAYFYIQHYASPNKNIEHHKSKRIDKEEEEPIIPLAHTGAQPGTMMVQPQNATSAIIAMDGSGRPVYLARIAVFQLAQVAVLDCELELVFGLN